MMKLVLTAFASAFLGATIATSAIFATSSVLAQKARRPFKTKRAGDIPNQFGEFRFASGSQQDRLLFFENQDGVITWVTIRGNTLPNVAFQVHRVEENQNKPKKPDKRNKQLKVGSFNVNRAGDASEDWGQFVGASGDANNVTLTFRDIDSNLRYVYTEGGNTLKPVLVEIGRKYDN